MKAERLQQLSPIFRQAVELSPDECASFLDAACAGDAAMRRDVERLISAHERAGSFIESPAYERAAVLLAETPTASLVGQLVAHYRVVAPLGTGGMGVVYLAEDTRLDRKVALKLLPTQLTQDEQRVRRFIQEAKVVSALNHPNILTIHEIGEFDTTRFIATEHVDGQTLRERLNESRLALADTLEIATQVASALTAAHGAGIVHRDIKPENVMIRPDGLVKILDFGIAKLSAPVVVANALNKGAEAEATPISARTSPGMIIGTASYMSPEQARGEVVDARSDIFSFGVMLYEMLAGKQPFAGEGVIATIGAMLHTEPALLDESETPRELRVSIEKCLSKDRDARYQTAKELLVDLKDLQKHLEFETLFKQGDARTSDAPAVEQTPGTTADVAGTRKSSSAEYLVGEFKRHKAAAVAVVAVLVVGLGFGIYKVMSRKEPASPFQPMKISRLTSTGKATEAVISPDGRQVIYVVNEGGRRGLWLRQIATTSDVQLGGPESVLYRGLTTSRDGNFLYYLHGSGIGKLDVYQMPILGGAPRKVVEDVDTPISFSPDGKQFAFARNEQEESALMVANADGSGERKIAARKPPNVFGTRTPFEGGLAWSPDGKRIGATVMSIDTTGTFVNVVEIPVGGGGERPLTSRRWYQIWRLDWLADGSGLVMSAAEKNSDARSKQLWYVPYPSGQTRKITNDLNDYTGVSLSADSSTLATVQADTAASIWVAPYGDAARATQLTSSASKVDGLYGVAWTPDGKIVYHSAASGAEGIWISEADGTNRRRLTVGETVDYLPSVSPDGRYILFVSERAGTRNIWRMDIDGSNPKRLTSGPGQNPQVTPDGQWVIYQFRGVFWRVRIDGGESVKLSREMMLRPAVSPDGKLIACSLGQPSLPARLAVIPIEGGAPVKVFAVQPEWPANIRWTSDGRALTYVALQNGVSEIWSQPLDGGEPKKLTNFKAQRIFSFDWSRDNKLVISHGASVSDVVLIRSIQ